MPIHSCESDGELRRQRATIGDFLRCHICQSWGTSGPGPEIIDGVIVWSTVEGHGNVLVVVRQIGLSLQQCIASYLRRSPSSSKLEMHFLSAASTLLEERLLKAAATAAAREALLEELEGHASAVMSEGVPTALLGIIGVVPVVVSLSELCAASARSTRPDG